MSPRILVSNDDGMAAAGINALAEHLQDLGEVWVIAPDRERSAVSHAISLHKPLRVRELAPRRFTVDGTPTDAVYMAQHELMDGPPDLVVSGINHGANLGSDVLYSGTVSAAMEGALFGHKAIAISLAIADVQPLPALDRQMFLPAARFARSLAESVLNNTMSQGVLLNVNVPPLAADAIQGVKLTRLGFTDWSDQVVQRTDPRGKAYYWIGGGRLGHDQIPDSDNNALAAGYISVTPVHYDLTDYRSFDYVRSLNVSGFTKVADGLGSTPLPHPVMPTRGKR